MQTLYVIGIVVFGDWIDKYYRSKRFEFGFEIRGLNFGVIFSTCRDKTEK